LRNLHRIVLDQLPLIVCRVEMSLSVPGLPQAIVKPSGPLVRVDAPLARLPKARLDLREPLLGKQPPLFRLCWTDWPDATSLIELGDPPASTRRRLLRLGRT
jgi:hypothetical protein